MLGGGPPRSEMNELYPWAKGRRASTLASPPCPTTLSAVALGDFSEGNRGSYYLNKLFDEKASGFSLAPGPPSRGVDGPRPWAKGRRASTLASPPCARPRSAGHFVIFSEGNRGSYYLNKLFDGKAGGFSLAPGPPSRGADGPRPWAKGRRASAHASARTCSFLPARPGDFLLRFQSPWLLQKII